MVSCTAILELLLSLHTNKKNSIKADVFYTYRDVYAPHLAEFLYIYIHIPVKKV